MRILVADDDQSVLDTIGYTLRAEGFEVETAEDGEAALASARSSEYDLMILNVMMPRLFGTDVLRELQAETETPMMLLSARDARQDRIEGLDLGADDYITKPFSVAELAARVRAILRRRELDLRRAPLARQVGELELDYENSKVLRGGTRVNLTRSEFRLLTLLADRPGQTLSRRRIMEHLWRSSFIGEERGCDIHVSNLRRKLGDDSIETVRGLGYRLRHES
jgi:DNA-binding response OmpR family regulator